MAEPERRLLRDLESLEDRLADEKFARDLYRALGNNKWRRVDDAAIEVALSWHRAEEVVNELRTRNEGSQLSLEQTGGEGEVSISVLDELSRRGWRPVALDPSRQDPAHVSSR